MKCTCCIFLVLFTFCFFSEIVNADDNYRIKLTAIGVPKGAGNLEINFKFFTNTGPIEIQRIVPFEKQTISGIFEYDFEYSYGDIDRDFYLFGRLLSKDGSGKAIGFMPLKLVNIQSQNIDKSIVNKNRKRINLNHLKIIYFGEESLSLGKGTCYKKTTIKETGRAARESYPFVGFNGFTDENSIIALSAVKDLIEYRFINTCPNWNRLRGMLRDDMSQVWTNLHPKHLQKVLEYMKSINNLGATDDNWRIVHKIYNDVLISLLGRVGHNRLPNNQVIDEIVYERHIGLIASHLNYIIWTLDDIVNAYLGQKEYRKCLGLFSEIQHAIPTSTSAQKYVKEVQSMRNKMIQTFQVSTVCAAKMVESVDLREVTDSLAQDPVGMKYMQDYLTLFDHLDRLSGEMFPYRSQNRGNRKRIEEIKKYYKAFEKYMQ